MSEPVDLACLARAQAGDPQAFRVIYEHCAEVVHHFLARMLGDGAEDALQETFLRVLRALPRFDPAGPARLTTWVLIIARRVALNEEQSEARARRREREAQALEMAAHVVEPAPELRSALAAAVAALPPAQRSVFVLRECHALSYEEIAAVEETDVGTVKSRLFRARLALQERLRDHLDEDRRSRERRANV